MRNNKYNKNQKNQKNQVRKSNPFDGKISQLKRETLILVNLFEAKPFVQECFKRGIRVDVGSTYGDGVIIYEKK